MNKLVLQRLAPALGDAAHTGELNDHGPTAVLRQAAEYSSQLLLDLVLSAPENFDWVAPSIYSTLGSLKLARNVHADDRFSQNRSERCFHHRPNRVERTFREPHRTDRVDVGSSSWRRQLNRNGATTSIDRCRCGTRGGEVDVAVLRDLDVHIFLFMNEIFSGSIEPVDHRRVDWQPVIHYRAHRRVKHLGFSPKTSFIEGTPLVCNSPDSCPRDSGLSDEPGQAAKKQGDHQHE